MANYVIKELPTGMGNGSEGKQFPKMQVYTEFDYNKVVELVHTNSPAFSEATVRGVLDTLAVVMKSYLPMGHTMKIDNLEYSLCHWNLPTMRKLKIMSRKAPEKNPRRNTTT